MTDYVTRVFTLYYLVHSYIQWLKLETCWHSIPIKIGSNGWPRYAFCSSPWSCRCWRRPCWSPQVQVAGPRQSNFRQLIRYLFPSVICTLLCHRFTFLSYHCTHLYIRCIISLLFLLGSHLKSGVKVVARKWVSRIAMEMLRYQIDWNLEIWKNKISYIIIYHAQKITQHNAANLR